MKLGGMGASEILNWIFGAGLIGSVIAVATLRSTVRKARADAAKAEAEAEAERARAETVRVDNAEHATRILIENIVKPLREELNATREELQATKREMGLTKRTMSRLARAVEAVNGCRHVSECPVRQRLLRTEVEAEPVVTGAVESRARGQP